MVVRIQRAGILIVLAGVLVLFSACSSTGGPASQPQLSEDPLLGKFIWHDLITDDVAEAKRFYAEVLGWTYEDSARPGGGGPYSLIKSGDRYIGGIVQLDDPGDEDYSRWLGYMSVEDVDVALVTTEASGGGVLVAASNVGNVGRVAAIQDPQGAVLGIARSKHGDPVDLSVSGKGQITWNELVTSDSEAAAGFYRTLTGLDVETISRRGGAYTILKSGDMRRAGILDNPMEQSPPAWLTFFSVNDPAIASEKVRAEGGNVLLAPADEFREGTLALIQDTTGAVLVLQRWPL